MAKSKIRAFVTKSPGSILSIPQGHPDYDKLEELCIKRFKRRGIEFKKSMAVELTEPELIDFLVGNKSKGIEPHPSVLNGTITEIETAEQREEREIREAQAKELVSFAALADEGIVNLETLEADQCKVIAGKCGISLQGLKDLKGLRTAIKNAVKEKVK